MKKMMSYNMFRILSVVFAVVLASGMSEARTAGEILAGCASTIDRSPSVDVRFELSGNGGKSAGSMLIADDAFFMKTPQICVWFDGTTQWTYITSTQEVSITEPTPDELMESNPFTILHNADSYYKARLLGSTATSEKLELAPLSASAASVSKATVVIDKKTGMPSSLRITFSNGNDVDIKITGITVGKKLPASTFRYNAAAFPAAEIIDLR